jgi:hypothetical protein
MKAQHKTLPDGSGAGKGWILAQNANKGFFTMAQMGQQPWAGLYNQQQGGGQRGGRNRGRGGRNNFQNQWAQGPGQWTGS